MVSVMAATTTGMLSQKIACQPIASTSAPPTTGPRAIESPTVPPQMPIARARSRASRTVLVMIDIATGFSIEPPIACSIRAAMS